MHSKKLTGVVERFRNPKETTPACRWNNGTCCDFAAAVLRNELFASIVDVVDKERALTREATRRTVEENILLCIHFIYKKKSNIEKQ